MNKEELITFLQWLQEEKYVRWYMISEDGGGLGEEGVVDRYLNEKEEFIKWFTEEDESE